MEIIGLDLHKRERQLSIKAEDGTITDRRIATSRERFTAVFSRRIVGWSMQPEMTAQLVTDAPVMAVWRRAARQRWSPIRTAGRNIRVNTFSDCSANRRHLQHESRRQYVGQRRRGKLFLHAEDRARASAALWHAPRSSRRYFRLY